MSEPKHILQRLFTRWKRTTILALLIQSLAFGILLACISYVTFSVAFIPALIIFSLVFSIGHLWWLNTKGPNIGNLAAYLNQNYPALEQSADLLLSPPQELGSLATLQKNKIENTLAKESIKVPNKLIQKGILLILSILISGIIFQVPKSGLINPSQKSFSNPEVTSSSSSQREKEVCLLENIQIEIIPPAYTRLRKSRSKTPNLEIPYNAQATWNTSFSSLPDSVQLVFGRGKSLALSGKNKNNLSATQRLKENDFYFLKWKKGENAWQQSDYFQINIIADNSPSIQVKELENYASYSYDSTKTITLKARVEDDYGVSQARIIATLSKGEGESVKFRDDTLYFNTNFQARSRQYNLEKKLKLETLNMEPGDELYLHFEATDNRTPLSQTTKTFKYIIVLEDSTKVAMQMFGGLAVDRMPEYFRSQRQIIIDTEKLLEEKNKIKLSDFKAQSNNIGIDQKVLRLRYGKFLGEEFETVIGVGVVEEESEEHDHEEEEHDHKAYEHDHDHDNNHEELPEGVESDDEEIEELEPYAHLHDISEEVTYYDATTSSKLRVALTNMWDAELHLRMGRPKQALPYEYKALKLIKQIQQASRIYVERIGFDAPVIKVAEKRLSGELDEISSNISLKKADQSDALVSIKAAIPLLEQIKQNPRPLTKNEKTLLQKAGNELATFAVEQGGSLLSDLQKIRALIEEKVVGSSRIDYINDLQETFWQLLPEDSTPKQVSSQGKDELRQLFLNEIGKL